MNELFRGFAQPNAAFSECRRYRYALLRHWGEGGQILFVMLNPSTADEQQDDPTIRRCIRFAKQWGYGRLAIANLFAWRATDPKDMKAADDPVGPANNEWLRGLWLDSDATIAAWGVHGQYRNRDRLVRQMLPGMLAIRFTKDGHPAHPLYLPSSCTPVSFDLPQSIGATP